MYFADLDQDRLTKTKISAVIRAVSRWKNLAQLYTTDSMIEKIEKMDNELKILMGSLGAKVKVDNVAPGEACIPRKIYSLMISFPFQ
jgi:hypothetical protein